MFTLLLVGFISIFPAGFVTFVVESIAWMLFSIYNDNIRGDALRYLRRNLTLGAFIDESRVEMTVLEMDPNFYRKRRWVTMWLPLITFSVSWVLSLVVLLVLARFYS